MGNPVSGSGLTKCSQCGVHIKAGEACPFCAGANDAARRPGRGGVIAAGLLSVGIATAACDDDDPEPTPDDAQAVDGQTEDAAVPDIGAQPLYGIPGDMAVPPPVDMSPPAPDMVAQPPYGIPPDAEVRPDAAVLDTSVMPLYGAPPDAGMTPDSGIVPPYGIPPDQPDEGTPVPLYGIPPEPEQADAAKPDALPPDAEVAVPLYGIPPDRE